MTEKRSFVGAPLIVPGGGKIFINPGTGPIEDTSEKHARENIEHFLTDCKTTGLHFVRIPERDYGEGRYAFLVWKDRICHEIQMPGLPLARVRFMSEEGQSAWDFPRLYVDGSSWLWELALLSEKDFEYIIDDD